MRWLRILHWLVIAGCVALIGWIGYDRFVLLRGTSKDFYFFAMAIIAMLRAIHGLSTESPVNR